MLFRPEFWPTAVALPVLVVLTSLGSWQWEEYRETVELIEEIATRAAPPPIDLSTDPRIPREDFAFRTVRVTGRFNHESEFFLVNRLRGAEPGLNLVTPLTRTDGGGVVLVDRGWVPLDRREPETRPGSQPDGEVTVTGVFRIPVSGEDSDRRNEPARNEWFSIDLTAMAAAAEIWPPPKFYIYATGVGDADLPRPNKWRIDIANDHLSIAIALFALAAAVAAAYIVYHWRSAAIRES